MNRVLGGENPLWPKIYLSEPVSPNGEPRVEQVQWLGGCFITNPDADIATPTAGQDRVLAAIAAGMHHPEAAKLLFISPSTVKTQMKNYLGRIGAPTAQQGMRALFDSGYYQVTSPITPEQPLSPQTLATVELVGRVSSKPDASDEVKYSTLKARTQRLRIETGLFNNSISLAGLVTWGFLSETTHPAINAQEELPAALVQPFTEGQIPEILGAAVMNCLSEGASPEAAPSPPRWRWQVEPQAF